jgi:WD40 repeat protein
MPALDEIEAKIRQLGLGINSRMESIEKVMKSIAESENSDVELEEQRTELKTIRNLKNCLQSAASIVSSASTYINDRSGKAAYTVSGSEFGDIFQPASSESTRTWIESNKVSEVAESDVSGKHPAAGGSSSIATWVDPEAEWDSDEEHDLELATTLLDLGKLKLKDKDFAVAESRLKSCIGIVTEKELTVAVSSDLSMVKLNAMSELITAFREQLKWDEAHQLLRDRITLLSRNSKTSGLDILLDTLLLAEILSTKGNFTEALLYARKSYQKSKRMGPSRKAECIRSLVLLVNACSASGKQDESDAYSSILHTLKTDEMVEASSPAKKSAPIASRIDEVDKLKTHKAKPSMKSHLGPQKVTAVLTLGGHTTTVWTIAFSPDGKQLASSAGGYAIKLWDIASGVLLQALTGHTSVVSSILFSSNGKLLASASFDHTIRLWDAASGALLHTLEGHPSFAQLIAFSPNGKLLASTSRDNDIKLWDTASGVLLQTLKRHLSTVTAVAFSPDGRLLVSASYSNALALWETASGVLLRTLDGHSDGALAVAFSPDGKQLVSSSIDRTVKLWNPASGVVFQTLKGHLGTVRHVAFSPDGRLLASASDDKTVKLWDTASGVLLQSLEGHSNIIIGIAFSPDGMQLVSASDDHTLKLWDATSGVLFQTLGGHLDKITAVAFSPDGKLLASASNDKTIKLWG